MKKEYNTIFDLYADTALAIGENATAPAKPKCTLEAFLNRVEMAAGIKESILAYFVDDHVQVNNAYFPKKLNPREVRILFSQFFDLGFLSFELTKHLDKQNHWHLLIALTVFHVNGYIREQEILKDVYPKELEEPITDNIFETDEEKNDYTGDNFDC